MLQVRILFRARIWIVRSETELSRVHLLPVVCAIGKAAERRVHPGTYNPHYGARYQQLCECFGEVPALA